MQHRIQWRSISAGFVTAVVTGLAVTSSTSFAQAPAPARETYADLPGVRIWYRDTGGAGIPVVLLHATTGSSPYPLKATLTWKISWTGTGNTGGALPDGTFGTTTPLAVQEIQTVVR